MVFTMVLLRRICSVFSHMECWYNWSFTWSSLVPKLLEISKFERCFFLYTKIFLISHKLQRISQYLICRVQNIIFASNEKNVELWIKLCPTNKNTRNSDLLYMEMIKTGTKNLTLFKPLVFRALWLVWVCCQFFCVKNTPKLHF